MVEVEAVDYAVGVYKRALKRLIPSISGPFHTAFTLASEKLALNEKVTFKGLYLAFGWEYRSAIMKSDEEAQNIIGSPKVMEPFVSMIRLRRFKIWSR